MSRYRFVLAKALALAAVIAILAAYDSWALGAAEADSAAKEQMAAALVSSGPGPYATDGVFSGTAEGYGGPVTTQVTVENGWITAVDIVDASLEDEAWLEMASVLPARILEAQTPSIDVVSGATFTSTGILNGATEALIESMGGAPDAG
ncbi:MAG: FMN-binding protein [Eggerthellaceae bacterium]|nr:FMN-binding protein [Eggerthellaceae bacterium]